MKIIIRNSIYCLLLFSLILFSCKRKEETKDVLYVYQDETSRELAITCGNDLLTILHYDRKNFKPYFAPVNTLNGSAITRGWPDDPRPFEPVDHPHHTGLWFNYGDINGIDFWGNRPGIDSMLLTNYGRIRADTLIFGENTGDKVYFQLESTWVTEEGKELIREKSSFVIGIEQDLWYLIRSIEIKAITNLQINDNKEGLFAIRLAREFQSNIDEPRIILDKDLNISENKIVNNENKSGVYLSSEGKGNEDIWGTQNDWVMLSGLKENDSISILILDHPDNINHPPNWHARNYGLLTVNNFGRKSYEPESEPLCVNLKEGEFLSLKYMLCIKNKGYFSEKMIPEIYKNFTELY